jgi:hypothetical protein
LEGFHRCIEESTGHCGKSLRLEQTSGSFALMMDVPKSQAGSIKGALQRYAEAERDGLVEVITRVKDAEIATVYIRRGENW